MMTEQQSYRKAFYAAVALHFFLALLLIVDISSQRPVLKNEAKNEPGEMTPVQPSAPQKEIVKAVSVDNQEVAEAVNELKQQRIKQVQAEQARQQALAKQAEQARQARVLEQQRLQKLKEETEKIAIARKKQMEEEKKRLKQLALQKEQEAKRLKELKEKQRQETKKLAELKKKQLDEKLKKEQQAKAEQKIKQQKEAELKQATAKAAAAKEAAAREAAAKQAALNAANQARIAGEVDKYKAMIVNAIGRQWILPDNVDSSLSSQFRIRLAPDGAVLEVSLTRSSGDPILDRSAQSAIYKASPLPVPSDPATFDLFREISLTVRPENVRG